MKLAILYTEDIPRLYLLEEGAKKAGFKPYLFHLRDLRFFINKKGTPDIKFNNVSLKDFSLVYVCGFWGFQNEVSLLGKFCAHYKIPLLDTAVRENPIISKNDDLLLFARRGFPLIKTVFLQSKGSAEILSKEFSFPIVAKEIRGKRGFDVFLISNKRQLQEFLRGNIHADKTFDTQVFQFQEFIPADFDVRLIVLGGRVLGAIERRASDPNEFRHNIALGGIAKKFTPTAEMQRLAIKAAKLLKFEFCGVDFIIHKKTGKLYLLEVNRSPGFEGFIGATGIDVPFELMKFFLRFLGKPLK